MNRFAIAVAVGAAALFVSVDAGAGTVTPRSNAALDAAQDQRITDFSSHRRNYRHHHRVVRRYYSPRYAYAPAPYYAPTPVVSFGFGFGGGPRYFGHRYHRHW